MSPNFLVIDTCVWIDLVATPRFQELIIQISKVLDKDWRLVLPESVRTEFDRNRTNTTNTFARSLKGSLATLTTVRQLVPGLETKVDDLTTAVQASIGNAEKVVAISMAAVDSLLAQADQWKTQPAHMADACNRCLDLRPPARIQNRSSVGDCLLWSCVLDRLQVGNVWFCTANVNDFSEPKRHDQLHAQLQDEVQKAAHTLNYFSTPNKLLEAIAQKKQAFAPPKDLPVYSHFAPEPPGSCPMCGATETFSGRGAYLRSQFGGLTLQYVCRNCGFHFDTGDSFD